MKNTRRIWDARFDVLGTEPTRRLVNGSDDDPVLDALGALVEGLQEDMRHDVLAIERALRVRELRLDGLRYRDISVHAERPTVLELLNTNLQLLHGLGHTLRVTSARALYGEGLTMNAIATEFGVSRQRVSELLRRSADEGQR